MNVLTEKEMTSGSAHTRFIKQLEHESKVFNELKGKFPSTFGIFTRKPKKINGINYIEQLIKNHDGSFSIQNVRLDKVLSGKFKEVTLGLPVIN